MNLSKRGDSEGWGVRWAAVHGVTKSWTWLSDWTTTKIWSGLLFSMLFISLCCSVDYMGNHFLSCDFEVLLLISSLHWLQSVNPLCCHFPHNFLHWRVFFFLVSLSPVGLPIIASTRLLPQSHLEQSLNLEFLKFYLCINSHYLYNLLVCFHIYNFFWNAYCHLIWCSKWLCDRQGRNYFHVHFLN